MSQGLPPLVPGEIAWACDVVAVADGRVAGPVVLDDEMRRSLTEIGRRLYLETAPRDAGSVWLVHRAGWPFDLRLAEGDPTSREATALRPTGAGDEVMRDLIESFEAAHEGLTLYIHAMVRG